MVFVDVKIKRNLVKNSLRRKTLNYIDSDLRKQKKVL